MFCSMLQRSSTHQEVDPRYCGEGDVLKVIIFMLDNNLLEDDQTSVQLSFHGEMDTFRYNSQRYELLLC